MQSGVPLLDDYRCALFGLPERPAVCLSLRPTNEMCGTHRDEAMARLNAPELATRPSRVSFNR
jgi:hypothetical protein